MAKIAKIISPMMTVLANRALNALNGAGSLLNMDC